MRSPDFSSTSVDDPISIDLVERTARELMSRAAISIPGDFREGVAAMREHEDQPLALYVLDQISQNYDAAEEDRRPMCGDTGLPRYYVKMGNTCSVEGGFVALERALRQATADATREIPIRPNRVHPLTRKDFNNNVGIHAPEVQYSFEPDGDWMEITTVHKGGLFGTDYRMLFPADGVGGIKRFVLDTLVEFGRRGLACQPAVVGLGLGGSKDTTMRIAKEALTFDDVLLQPDYSDVLPREVDLTTRLTTEISLNIPLLSAAMDTVTEARLAIGLAQEGGIGILHKSMPVDDQARQVRAVKKYESGVVKDPITISPNATPPATK